MLPSDRIFQRPEHHGAPPDPVVPGVRSAWCAEPRAEGGEVPDGQARVEEAGDAILTGCLLDAFPVTRRKKTRDHDRFSTAGETEAPSGWATCPGP